MRKKRDKHVPWYEQYFGPDYLIIDIHENTDQEVEFICDIMKLTKGARLLDVPCGYGRHLAPLVKRGIQAVGCDLSSFMLEEARRRLGKKRRSRLIRCDIRKLPFADAFDYACTMFNSFGYFDTEQENFRALTSIAQALKPGGLYLLDLVNRDFLLLSLARKDWFIKNGVVVLEEKWFDTMRNRTEIDVTVIDKNGKRDYHHSIRMFSLTEITMVLEAAGFAVIDVFGGFKGEEFDLNCDRMLILSQVQKTGNG